MAPQFDPDAVFESCEECAPLIEGLQSLKALEISSARDELRKQIHEHQTEKPHKIAASAMARAKECLQGLARRRRGATFQWETSVAGVLRFNLNGIETELNRKEVFGLATGDAKTLRKITERLDRMSVD